MYFTREDYLKIEEWLKQNAIKDTEFKDAELPVKEQDTITLVQEGKNVKVSLKDFIDQLFNLGVSDFLNITDKYKQRNITIEQAISLISSRARKKGQVITFLNSDSKWVLYQFKGELNQWNIIDLWDNIFDINKYIINSIIPDEEDLTMSLPDSNGNSYISLKDREYNPQEFSGKGRIILRKNIVEEYSAEFGKVKKNILVQNMINQPNTIYEIRYDFDLNGKEITIPEGCVLDFKGGSLSNGILNNVGESIGLTNGFKCNIKTFNSIIKEIKVSYYGCNVNSNSNHNHNVFQTAINQKINLIIDNTKNSVDTELGINISKELNITQYINIKGGAQFSGNIIFPNSDGFVWNKKTYSYSNNFENLSITSKGHCFNFCNNGGERPYSIYQSNFINLRCKSLTADCFYGGNYRGAGGDILVFQVLFNNIYLHTPRYGFNGILGATDFIVDRLTDWKVSEVFFYNTCPNEISNVNSSFSGTKHFMLFDNNFVRYGTNINLINCSFEAYSKEVFKCVYEDTMSASFDLNIKNCSISYNSNELNNYVDFYPIDLYNINSINFDNFYTRNIKYLNDKCLIKTKIISHQNIKSNKDFDIFYTPLNIKYKVRKNESIPLGPYNNYTIGKKINCQYSKYIETDFLGIKAQMVNIEEDNKPLSIGNNIIKINTNKNINISYISFKVASHVFGEGIQEDYSNFIFITNISNFNIIFKSGTPNTICGENLYSDYILKSNETILCIKNKNINRYVVINIFNGNRIGTTANRPILTINDKGFYYFDITLNKNIYWDGMVWIDSQGNNINVIKEGTTTQRPTDVKAGFYYFDTTLNKPVWKKDDTTNTWVDATGAEV